MRVLILSCGTGGGHNAAASAMKEALEAWTGTLESVFATRSDVEQKELEDMYGWCRYLRHYLAVFIKLVMPTADCHGVHQSIL